MMVYDDEVYTGMLLALVKTFAHDLAHLHVFLSDLIIV